MLKEIQTARLSEESEGGHSRGRVQWLAMVVLTRGTKGTRRSKERSGRCEVADKGERM